MERYKVIALYLLILVVVGSCKVKKNSETYVSERNQISYALPSENTLVIENLCDSINRPLQTVKTISKGVSETKVEIRGNRLVVKTVYDTIFQEKIVEKIRTVKEVEEVPYTPKWRKTLEWALLTICFLVFAFPKIATIVNGMFKKAIGFPF